MPILVTLLVILILYIFWRIGKATEKTPDDQIGLCRAELRYLNITWTEMIAVYDSKLEVGQAPDDCHLLRFTSSVEGQEPYMQELDHEFIIKGLQLDLSLLMQGYIMDSSQSYNSELMDDIVFALNHLVELHNTLEGR